MKSNFVSKLVSVTASVVLLAQFAAPQIAKAETVATDGSSDEAITSYLSGADTYGMCLRDVCETQRVQCVDAAAGDDAALGGCEEQLMACELSCLIGPAVTQTEAPQSCSNLVAIACQE